jgi:hypothetical protein
MGFEYAESDRPVPLYADAVSGWMNHRQLQVIEHLREENRVLREQLGDRRVRLDDHQRRRLAVKAKALGRKVLAEVASIVTRDLVGLASETDRPTAEPQYRTIASSCRSSFRTIRDQGRFDPKVLSRARGNRR